jgi:hypothetical protein
MTYRLSPVDRDVGTIYIGRGSILEILKPRVARLLSKASLVAKKKETTDAILTGLEAVVLNETKTVA